jgi:hypothetical protein
MNGATMMGGGIDRSIVAGLGFKGAISNDYAQTMSQIYWDPALFDGTMINPAAAAIHANMRMKPADGSRAPMTALIPDGGLATIPDAAIKKAVFGNRYTLQADTTRGSASGGERETFADMTARDMDNWERIEKSFANRLISDTQRIKKAMIAGTSSTTGSYLMHVIADEGVTYLYKRPYPIQALIPVEANKGRQALWDVVGPYEYGSAFFGTEDQAFTMESDPTTHNRTDFVKYLFTVGRVTKAAQFAGLSQIPSRDMLAIRIDMCQDALRALRERRMLGVTSDVSDTNFPWTSANSLEYKGLYELIQTNTSGTTATQTWVTSAGNTYSAIMKDMDDSYRTMVKFGMQPNLALCDFRTFSVIRRGLMEYFRTEPIKEFVQGVAKINLVFPAHTGLPLVPHPFMPQSGAAASTYGAIMLLDTRLLARRALWQDTYEELGKINLSQKFVVSGAETVIDKSDIGDDATGGGIPAYSLHGGVFAITA